MREKRRKGFTLVELMVVITILALLSGGVALFLIGRVSKARKVKAKADLTLLADALDLYHLEKDKYPESLEELAKTSGEGSDPLIKGGKVPKDPWGNEYHYQKAEKKYVLLSFGADGQQGGEGNDKDISLEEEEEE
jgi:general secretion pathway protein G